MECRRLGMAVSITLGVIFILFSAQLMGIFTDEREIINLGKYVMIVIAINQPLQSSQLILSGALRGAGDTRTVALCTLVGMLFIRPVTSYAAVKVLGLGLVGAWSAVIIDQVVRSVVTYVVFARGKWEKIKV